MDSNASVVDALCRLRFGSMGGYSGEMSNQCIVPYRPRVN